MHPSVHSNIIYNSQDMETAQVFINRWMVKEDEWNTTQAFKKKWSLAICSNMDGFRGHNAKK